MKKLILLLLILPLLLSCNSVDVKPEMIVFESDNLRCNDTVLVFNPHINEKITEAKATLFLLHGYSGSYSNWGDKYDLQDISNKTGFRIITPDGFYNGWYLNNIDKNQMQWRTFFDEELYPQLQEKYGYKRENTFISGLSMGGHGAINIFMDDTTRFLSAGSMSGVLNLHQTRLTEKEISKILGAYKDNPLFDNESAINRLETLKGLSNPILVTCGYNDVYSVCTIDFAEKCREMGIRHIEVLSPGGHTWKYWGHALDMHIWYFTQMLEGKNLGY